MLKFLLLTNLFITVQITDNFELFYPTKVFVVYTENLNPIEGLRKKVNIATSRVGNTIKITTGNY